MLPVLLNSMAVFVLLFTRHLPRLVVVPGPGAAKKQNVSCPWDSEPEGNCRKPGGRGMLQEG
jgi:hypothetical protein